MSACCSIGDVRSELGGEGRRTVLNFMVSFTRKASPPPVASVSFPIWAYARVIGDVYGLIRLQLNLLKCSDKSFLFVHKV